MRRRTFVLALPAAALLALAGCESSTDIRDISASGRWDGVGSLQAQYSSVTMDLQQGSNGSVSGTWAVRAQHSYQGSVSGSNTAGNMELTFFGFPSGTTRFQGRFTNDFRMEGTMDGANLNGSAIFRRTSF
jgi:hypothetical protein